MWGHLITGADEPRARARRLTPGIYGAPVIVFVHGVPETSAIWDDIRSATDRPSVALPLPGFGCGRPAGFGATKDSYVSWLVSELDAIGEPVDLVGHDWGAGLTYRIATAHGDRLRSWAADVANILHPDYEWHAFAQTWQSPEGEGAMEAMLSMSPEERAPMFESIGVPAERAVQMTSSTDDVMAASILDLYRSATPNPHADWGPLSPTRAPGLVLHPTNDPFGDERMAQEVASTLSASFVRLEGVGHFWPYEAPAVALAALETFWSSLD